MSRINSRKEGKRMEMVPGKTYSPDYRGKKLPGRGLAVCTG
jgi:hypothetical protein